MHFLTQLISKKTLASILVVFLMVPASLMVLPQKSEASMNALIGAGAGMVGCFIQTGLNNMIQGGLNMLTSAFPALGMFAGGPVMVPIDPIPSEIRECSLDTIVWAFINDLIAGILRDMVVWVESGFKGTPGFVSNIGGFVLGTAQHTFDRFIDENLSFMCEPFQFNIGLTLTRLEIATRAERFSCTLDGIVGNVNNFLSGNFADGGWDGFVTVNTTRGGNPLTLLIDANMNITGMQELQLEREFDLLAWGRGFFSTPDEDGNLVTPGVVIEDQLNHALGSPQRRIEMADEINELIDALIARFITDLFGAGSDVYGGLISSDGSAGWASERADVYFNIEERQQTLLSQIDELIELAEEAENEEVLEAAQQLREDTLALDPDSPDTMHLLGGLERTAGYLRAALAGGELEPYEPPELDFTMPQIPSSAFGPGSPTSPTSPTTPLQPFSCAQSTYTVNAARNVSVSSQAELTAALQNAQAGDVITLAAGNYGSISLSGIRPSSLIKVQGTPGAVIRQLRMTNSSNIQIEGVRFEYGPDTQYGNKVVEFVDSRNIRLVGNTIVGNPNGGLVRQGSEQGNMPTFGVRFAGGGDHVLANNSISWVDRGVLSQSIRGFTYESNTLTNLGYDGFMSQLIHDGVIQHNYIPDGMHHNAGPAHADFIQFDAGNGAHSSKPSSNIAIRGNVFLQGPNGHQCSNGSQCGAVQGIFLGGAMGTLNGQEHVFENFVIEQNLFCASGMNGITSGLGAKNIQIRNNVHLTCPPPFGADHVSWIRFRGEPVINSVIENNITGRASNPQEAIATAKTQPWFNNCVVNNL